MTTDDTLAPEDGMTRGEVTTNTGEDIPIEEDGDTQTRASESVTNTPEDHTMTILAIVSVRGS